MYGATKTEQKESMSNKTLKALITEFIKENVWVNADRMAERSGHNFNVYERIRIKKLLRDMEVEGKLELWKKSSAGYLYRVKDVK